ncbi:MAG TPA: hypothetical protein VEK08_11510 [Planctomycetota bacterium]|nr:hypothetical protein [Planctomycetota bacterium]
MPLVLVEPPVTTPEFPAPAVPDRSCCSFSFSFSSSCVSGGKTGGGGGGGGLPQP